MLKLALRFHPQLWWLFSLCEVMGLLVFRFSQRLWLCGLCGILWPETPSAQNFKPFDLRKLLRLVMSLFEHFALIFFASLAFRPARNAETGNGCIFSASLTFQPAQNVCRSFFPASSTSLECWRAIIVIQ